jgi:hypothetical protein
MTSRTRTLTLLASALLLLIGQPPLDAAPAPEAKPADAKARGAERLSLTNGIVQFKPPPAESWELVRTATDARGAVRGALYLGPGGTTLLVEAVGGGTPRDSRQAELMKQTLVDGVKRMSRSKKDMEVAQDALVHDDPRFFLVIESQYKKDGQPQSVWRLWRNLPPHQVMITMAVVTEDSDAAAKIKETGFQVALDASLVPRGVKAPPAPDAPPIGSGAKASAATARPGPGAPAGDDQDSPEVAEARKALADAEAKVESELMKKKEYAAARKQADDAEAKLKEARAQEPPDRQAIARASLAWIDAKKPVEKMRREALDKDAAVVEARKQLAEARKAARQP